ncbi:kinesin-like protein KIF25 isoform X4 [Salmo trutta]|uniref:kinesin-like protein KIF25 isoform X4 n=1 Tax=Salmo trutta TaxID=8032 RepID=UPI001130F7BA|nr:kinesin-like protein KIF25 isoform X4 [Salmo trutta]
MVAIYFASSSLAKPVKSPWHHSERTSQDKWTPSKCTRMESCLESVIFAHQVHLLEHKLRSKEERILELETENAILHLRLADCLGKLRRDHAEEAEAEAQKRWQHQRVVQQSTQSALAKLLSEVQILKQDLREVFAVYVNFATELENQSRLLLEQVGQASFALQGHHGNDVHSLQAQMEALERSLQEEKERSRTERERRKILHNTLVELRGNIRVHCRVRPVLPFDDGQGSTLAIGPATTEEVVQAVNDDTVVVNCTRMGNPGLNKMFEFERVHGPEDSQDVVFEEVKPLLTSLLDGYNVCIMAYGQTGSGKTHTMIGSQAEDPSGPQGEARQGVIPKAATELFRLISEKPAESHTVEVSVVEVYNNEVLDLLAKDEDGVAMGAKRDVITTSTGTSEVPLLSYVLVRSSADVMQLISSVLRLRARCPTLVHRDSSRSHLIVTLTVSSKSPNALALARRLQNVKKDMQRKAQKEWWSPRCRRANPMARQSGDERSASSSSSPYHSPSHSPIHSSCPSPRASTAQAPFRTKLQLVDLAGSECVGMSGVTGAALWETSCINRSLSALSDVLGALAEQRPHVPYRNSKLTHLLQDAIGGDAKLLVMLCVSPTQRYMTESLQSLGFGTRARQVQKDTPRRKNIALKLK